MTTLDRETIEEAARGILGALRGDADAPIAEATAGLRDQYERVIETLQSQYGHTRQTAREEIVDFLSDLEAIDPALPEILADAANELTRRKSRRVPAMILGAVLAIVAVAAWLFWRNPQTYRSLISSVNEMMQERSS